MSKGKLLQAMIEAEIYMLLLGFLLFVTVILPSMIAAAAPPVGRRATSEIHLRVRPEGDFANRMVAGEHIGWYVRLDAADPIDCFSGKSADARFGFPGGLQPVRVAGQGKTVRVGVWLARFPDDKPDAGGNHTVRLLLYPDRMTHEIQSAIETKSAAAGADRLEITLEPSNRFQAEVEVPSNWFQGVTP